jgi:hypothetical protein
LAYACFGSAPSPRTFLVTHRNCAFSHTFYRGAPCQRWPGRRRPWRSAKAWDPGGLGSCLGRVSRRRIAGFKRCKRLSAPRSDRRIPVWLLSRFTNCASRSGEEQQQRGKGPVAPNDVDCGGKGRGPVRCQHAQNNPWPANSCPACSRPEKSRAFARLFLQRRAADDS